MDYATLRGVRGGDEMSDKWDETIKRYKSIDEVERYKSKPLLDRMKDRTGIMKCVPLVVVDTIIEATAEIERMTKELEEAKKRFPNEWGVK